MIYKTACLRAELRGNNLRISCSIKLELHNISTCSLGIMSDRKKLPYVKGIVTSGE